MAGLAGLITTSPDSPLAGAWLSAAEGLLSHAAESAAVRWQQPHVHVTHVSAWPDREPLDVAYDGQTALFVAGTVHNAAELYAAAGGAVNGHALTPARQLLHVHRQSGAAGLHKLNGSFIIGAWDRTSRTLTLVADRFATRKLYYAALSDGLVFASEVKVLLAHPGVSRSIDHAGLAHFLALGYVIHDRTLYADVRLLPGGAMLRQALDRSAPAVERYWTPQFRTHGAVPTLDECMDEMAARIETAVARALGGVRRLALPLSGGLDSRTLLGFARRVNPSLPVNTVTVGDPQSYDVIHGRQLARRSRTQHRVLPLPPDFMAQVSEPFVWLMDGMVSAHNAWTMTLLDAVRSSDRVITGFLGDGLSGARLKDRMYHAGTVEQLIREAYPYQNVVFTDAELTHLLRTPAARRCCGVAASDFGDAIRGAQADALIDRFVVALLLCRQQRYLSYGLTVLGCAAPVAAPFTDTDVVDFFLRQPHQHRRRQQAYRQMIRRHLPDLARVSTGKELPLEPPVWWRQRLQWRLDRLQERSRQLLGIEPPDRVHYAHYGEWMRRPAMRAYLAGALTRGEHYLGEWFDMGQVRRLLARHQDGQADLYRQISALATLALWFERAEQIPVATAERAPVLAGQV